MTSSGGGLRVDQTLDVRGLSAPEGYRKAVEQLKGMPENDILELALDDGPVLETLPFGLRAEGHEILISEPIQGGIRLLVKKRALIP